MDLEVAIWLIIGVIAGLVLMFIIRAIDYAFGGGKD